MGTGSHSWAYLILQINLQFIGTSSLNRFCNAEVCGGWWASYQAQTLGEGLVLETLPLTHLRQGPFSWAQVHIHGHILSYK